MINEICAGMLFYLLDARLQKNISSAALLIRSKLNLIDLQLFWFQVSLTSIHMSCTTPTPSAPYTEHCLIVVRLIKVTETWS